MTTDDAVAILLDDIQEEFDAEGVLPLYTVAWSLASRMSRQDPDFRETCARAYNDFRSQHPGLLLVWMSWSMDVATAEAAAPGTPVVLDADPSARDARLLALVDPKLLDPDRRG